MTGFQTANVEVFWIYNQPSSMTITVNCRAAVAVLIAILTPDGVSLSAHPEGRRKSCYVSIRRHRWASREWKRSFLRVCTAFRTLSYDEADWTANFKFAIRKPETSLFHVKFPAFSLDGSPAKTTPYANFTPSDVWFCAEQKERYSSFGIRIGRVVDGCRPAKGYIKKRIYESANGQPELSPQKKQPWRIWRFPHFHHKKTTSCHKTTLGKATAHDRIIEIQ